MNQANEIEPLLDAKEVQRLLRCSLPLVYKLADRGQIPCIRWECPGEGKRTKTMLRFRKVDLLAFIRSHYRAGRPSDCVSEGTG